MKIIKPKQKRGVLVGDFNSLKSHERNGVKFLLDYGVNVTVVAPSRDKKSADFLIERRHRELKSPTGTSHHNIEHAFKKGAKQSEYLIFDARRSPKSDSVFINEIVRALQSSSRVKDAWIILKSGELCEIAKKEALKLVRKKA